MRLALRRLAVHALAVIVLLPAGTGCARRRKPPAPPAGASAPASATAPAAPATARQPGPFEAAFSAERAWKHLQAQVAMGPRAHGTEGYRAVQAYMREHLAACGAQVRDMTFTHQGRRDPAPETFTNVIGTFAGDSPEWVLLGTHYDTRSWADEDPDESKRTRPIQGANDGGSGTAVLLEIATLLKDRKPPLGVVIVFFDGEDYGWRREFDDYFLGSRALARTWDAEFPTRPRAALVLDMVADAELAFQREAMSASRFPELVEHLWAVGREQAPSAFRATGSIPVTDDHVPLMEIGIPATLLIDFEYPPWHTVEDTIDKCSPESLGITGRAVTASMLDRTVPVPPR